MGLYWAWGFEKFIKMLVGKPQGKRPLVRPRYRWKDNIKTNVREIGHALDSFGSQQGLVDSYHDSELSCSIKDKVFDFLSIVSAS